MALPYSIIEKIVWSAIVSLGFALLFNVPRRALWVVSLLGMTGFGIRTLLIEKVIGEQIVLSSLAGASAVGILGMYFAHRVHTPPIAFTVPAVVNMVPGKSGYEFIIGLVDMITSNKKGDHFFMLLPEVINDGLKTGFTILALALGIIVPILFFKTKTAKNEDLQKLVIEKFIRKTRMMLRKIKAKKGNI